MTSPRLIGRAVSGVLIAVLSATSCGQGSGAAERVSTAVEEDAVLRSRRAPAFQATILAYGQVTFAEYEQAIASEVACLRAEVPSVVVRGPFPDPASERMLAYDATLEGATRDLQVEQTFERAQVSCHRRYAADVGAIWAAQDAPSEEQRRTLLGGLAECLVGEGLRVSAEPDMDELMAALPPDGSAPSGVQACLDRYRRVFMASP